MTVKSYLTLSILLLLTLCTGCEGPTSVSAQPRTSKYEAEFGKTIEKNNDGDKNANLIVEANFLTDAHFACVKIEPKRLKQSKDLRDIVWADIEDQIAAYVGEKNSKINDLKTVWLVMDGSSLSAAGMGSADAFPFVCIIDFDKAIDQESVEQAEGKRAEQNVSHSIISSTRLAIGSKTGISGLNDSEASDCELAALTSKWNSDSEVHAALTIQPVRSFLTSIFDMASRMSPEAQKYSNLPNALRSIIIEINIDDESKEPVFVRGEIDTDDKELAKNLTSTIKDMLREESGFSLPGQNGADFGPAMNDQMMINPTVVGKMADVGKEIKEKRLLSVKDDAGKISIELTKPASLENAIAAVIADGKKQLEFNERVEKLKTIAEAIKAYEKEHGHLPSMNAINTEQAKELNVPAQFGWRTALLPYMNQNSLYASFDFDKPWNSKENLTAAESIPPEFLSFANDEDTTYQLVSGDDCVYRPSRPQPTVADISDRKIWTALFVESSVGPAETWIEPNAINLSDASLEDLGRNDENGILFINASFQVRALKRESELLLKVTTSDGGESMKKGDFFNISPR